MLYLRRFWVLREQDILAINFGDRSSVAYVVLLAPVDGLVGVLDADFEAAPPAGFGAAFVGAFAGVDFWDAVLSTILIFDMPSV